VIALFMVQLEAVFVISIGAVALLGHLLHYEGLSSWGATPNMALSTASAITIIGVALLTLANVVEKRERAK